MISSKQRAYLRGLANPLRPIFQIGKDGITENLTAQLSDALDARELIKIHVLQNSDYTARDAIEELSQALGAEPVQAIGGNLVLYRPARKEENRKIVLL